MPEGINAQDYVYIIICEQIKLRACQKMGESGSRDFHCLGPLGQTLRVTCIIDEGATQLGMPLARETIEVPNAFKRDLHFMSYRRPKM